MDIKNIKEFWLVWFETTQEWNVVFPGFVFISGKHGSVGHAHGAALKYLGRGEAEFECCEDNGAAQHYMQDEEFWIEHKEPIEEFLLICSQYSDLKVSFEQMARVTSIFAGGEINDENIMSILEYFPMPGRSTLRMRREIHDNGHITTRRFIELIKQ